MQDVWDKPVFLLLTACWWLTTSLARSFWWRLSPSTHMFTVFIESLTPADDVLLSHLANTTTSTSFFRMVVGARLFDLSALMALKRAKQVVILACARMLCKLTLLGEVFSRHDIKRDI